LRFKTNDDHSKPADGLIGQFRKAALIFQSSQRFDLRIIDAHSLVCTENNNRGVLPVFERTYPSSVTTQCSGNVPNDGFTAGHSISVVVSTVAEEASPAGMTKWMAPGSLPRPSEPSRSLWEDWLESLYSSNIRWVSGNSSSESFASCRGRNRRSCGRNRRRLDAACPKQPDGQNPTEPFDVSSHFALSRFWCISSCRMGQKHYKTFPSLGSALDSYPRGEVTAGLNLGDLRRDAAGSGDHRRTCKVGRPRRIWLR